MNVAVFGAAGWVGRAVLAHFAGRHTVRAFERSPQAWDKYDELDGAWDGEKRYGDMADFDAVDAAIEGCDGVVHLAAYFGYENTPEYDTQPFLVNVKGLWNVLESARRRGVTRVVHMGSCMVEHPAGLFFDAEVRSPEGTLYGISKRLQEEMCRQFHDAFQSRIIVFRPCSIVDSRLKVNRDFSPAGDPAGTGWVCRHDLAEGCHLALENESVDFAVLHTAGNPAAEAHCNVRLSKELLGLEYRGQL